jgi:hypothetical protein
MEDLYMQVSNPFRLSILAIGEWLMVLPPAVFITAAALHLLQPRQYEPAYTSWIIFEWTTTHISRVGAAMLFLVIPGAVVTGGCATLLRIWREDQALRHDAILGLTIFRRHLTIGLLTTATLLAAAILTIAVAHLVTD